MYIYSYHVRAFRGDILVAKESSTFLSLLQHLARSGSNLLQHKMLRKNSKMTDAAGNDVGLEGDGIVIDSVPKRSRIRDARLIRNCWLLMPIILLIVITFAVIPSSKRPFDLVSAISRCIVALFVVSLSRVLCSFLAKIPGKDLLSKIPFLISWNC